MQKQIVISYKKPYAHILKENGNFVCLCSENAFEPLSIRTIRLEYSEKYEKIENDLKIDYIELKRQFLLEKEKYGTFCQNRIKHEKNQTYVYDQMGLLSAIEAARRQAEKNRVPFDAYGYEKLIEHEFQRRVPKEYREDIDVEFEKLKYNYEKTTEIYLKYTNPIKLKNKKTKKHFIRNTEQKWLETANKFLSDFIIDYNKENPTYRPSKHCEACNKSVSYANWSKHVKTEKHINLSLPVHLRKVKEKKIVEKVECACGSKVFPQNMPKHLISTKHKLFANK